MEIQKTSQLAEMHGVKVLVYGESGAGKTRLAGTMGPEDETLLISQESGILSLRDKQIDTIDCSSIDDLREAYLFIARSDDATKYKHIAIDSISEIGEVCLEEELNKHKDGRAAYGEYAKTMGKLIRLFRDLQGPNVYFSAKLEHKDGQYQPMMPGRQVGPGLPYFFDEVFALRTTRDDNYPGGIRRWLQTVNDGLYVAKDRSGALSPLGEEADLSTVFSKIASGVTPDEYAKPKPEADDFGGDPAAEATGGVNASGDEW